MRAYAGKRACCCVCVEWWLYRLPLRVERESLRACAGEESVCCVMCGVCVEWWLYILPLSR